MCLMNKPSFSVCVCVCVCVCAHLAEVCSDFETHRRQIARLRMYNSVGKWLWELTEPLAYSCEEQGIVGVGGWMF